MKVIVMAGTRPEAIKVAPVVRELRKHDNVECLLCDSGQHKEMMRQAFSDFGMQPDLSLDVMKPGQTLAGLSSRLFAKIDAVFSQEKPEWVLVQGDTTTVEVSALCAFYREINIGHIEAGLRSFDRHQPFPEEVNRQIVSRVADLHFAPTTSAYANLVREGIAPDDVVVTGNTVIDALHWIRSEVGSRDDLLDPAVATAISSGKRIVLVTGHRRENLGDGFSEICKGIRAVADTRDDVFFIYPVHLNPRVQEPVSRILGGHPRIRLIQPLAYRQFIAHLNASYLVLTDSGGIQEEAPALGKPVLVMRSITERPEGVKAGVTRLVGPHATSIAEGVCTLLDDTSAYARMAHAVNPYGDGHAAERIVDALLMKTAHRNAQ